MKLSREPIKHTGKWNFAQPIYSADKIRRLGKLDYCSGVSLLPIMRQLGPGDVIVEIGAWIGDGTVVLERTGATVLAIEMVPEFMELLRLNVPQALLFCAAIGDGVKTIGWTLNETGLTVHAGTLVTIPLDALHLGLCSFLKISTDGMRMEILEGARETIERCRPPILIEFWESEREESDVDVIEKVLALGYRETAMTTLHEDGSHFDLYFEPRS